MLFRQTLLPVRESCVRLVLIVLVHITDTQWDVRRQNGTPYLNRIQLLKSLIRTFRRVRKISKSDW